MTAEDKTLLQKVNSMLPNNVCLQIYDMAEFPLFLGKLTDIWTGVILPKQEETEKISWVMSYLQYQNNNKDCYLIWFFTNQESDEKHLKSIKNNYKKRFFSHCVKSTSCEDVCPMEIPTQRAISKMNRKSVWRIWQLLHLD